MDAKGIASVLLDAKALKFNVAEPFTFASGIKSPVYMDCRLLISDVARRALIVDSMVDILEDISFDVVAGTASAGIPWGAWVADRMAAPLVYVRKKAKEHGTGKVIEGIVEKGERVVVIEDLVSTGMSSIASVESLRQAGAKVADCVSIFQYGMAESDEAFKSAKVKLHSLSDFRAAVEVSTEKRYLPRQDADKALLWLGNPKGWI